MRKVKSKLKKVNLPNENEGMKEYKKVTPFPQTPIIAIQWLDASFSEGERIEGGVPDNYRGGIVDTVVGYYLGTKNGIVVVSDSAYIRDDKSESFRHIWNIPTNLVISVFELKT
jgi:hypothetical protein